MGLFKKDTKSEQIKTFDSGVSNQFLPTLPELPQINSLPELPSSTNSNIQRMPIQNNMVEAIKTNISPPPSNIIEKRTMEIGEGELKNYSPSSMIKSPIFIKIDKFQEAVSKFEEVKKKVEEIEGTMIKIKEIKSKEESELIEWESDIRTIKEKIKSIDSSIFSSI